MSKKVSLVTPCYNGENYLSRYLECVLTQEYDNIELVLVNDGSTDKTEQIYLDYLVKLESKGIIVKYVVQENRGLAGAVCTGIKHVTGDYLVWPDSDDILLPNFISSRVKVLEAHPNAGIVICPVDIVHESDLSKIIKTTKCTLNWDKNGEINVFYNVLKLQGFFVFPGTFMIRMDMFKKTNPTMNFFHPREIGQDFQMLLPVSYRYKACYCSEVSFRYVIRDNSHSHAKKTKEESIKKYEIGKDVICSVLDTISFKNSHDKKYAYSIANWRFYLWMIEIGIQYRDKELFWDYYKLIDKSDIPKFVKREALFFRLPAMRTLHNIASKIKHFVLSNRPVE